MIKPRPAAGEVYVCCMQRIASIAKFSLIQLVLGSVEGAASKHFWTLL